MKKFVSLLLAVLMTAALFTGCAKQPQAPDQSREEAVTIRVGGLKGPTSMGLVKLLDDAENQKTANAIDFRMAASANELNPLFLKGELDIMAVPANLGSVLYNKTEGQVKMLAVSTLGVLYIVEKGGETVTDIKSLAGKTIYATGKGAITRSITVPPMRRSTAAAATAPAFQSPRCIPRSPPSRPANPPSGNTPWTHTAAHRWNRPPHR